MKYLKRNKACRSPSRLVFWDTETTQQKIGGERGYIENVFRLGVATRVRLDQGEVSRRSTLRFSDSGKFWNWLEDGAEKNSQTFVFAHNLAFDATITGLWHELDRGRFRLSDNTSLELVEDDRNPHKKPWTGLVCRQDPPTIFKIRAKRNSTFTFCDTLNWFKTSLEKLGDRIGLKKAKMPAFDDPDEAWYDYCERDVEVIERTMVDYIVWLRENDLGNFKMTAPSQAFTAFNHRFRKPNILIHSRPDVCELERDSYYGGRLESFYIGELRDDFERRIENSGIRPDRSVSDGTSNFYALDVNSLYPSVMRKLPYPTGLEEYKNFSRPESVKSCNLCHRTIGDVHINTQRTYPRRLPGVGIAFATGTFRTTLCGPELIRAVRSGDVTHVYKFARYSMKPLFTEYVDWFWSERRRAKEAGDVVGDLFAKLFLNSLYGKFGQLSVEWEEIGPSVKGEEWDVDHEIRYRDPGTLTIQNIAGVKYAKHRRTDHPQSFCAVASYVTAYARERMRNLMETAGTGNVFYIVTDGLFTNREGYERLKAAGEISETELGKLAVKDSADVGWIGGVHWYQIGETEKRGSNKKKAVVLSTGHALQEQWERLAGILRRGPTNTVRITPQIKKYAREYKRGTVLPNGDVVPLVFDEPPEL